MPILQTGRRRLQQGRSSTAGGGRPSAARPAAAAAAAGPVKMPHPKPPACTLDDVALQELQLLSQWRSVAKLQDQMTKSAVAVGDASYAFNQQVQDQRNRVRLAEERRGKRAASGRQGTVEDDNTDAQDRLDHLERTMKELSRRSEKGMRDLVDLECDMDAYQGGLRATCLRAEQASRDKTADLQRIRTILDTRARAIGDDGDDDGDANDGVHGAGGAGLLDDEEAVDSMLDVLAEASALGNADYARMTAENLYAGNNEYRGWKKKWYQGLHGDDAILPNHDKWFTRDGQPVMHFSLSAEMDEDDDLVVAREVIDTRCPLSMVEITDAYTSQLCKHSFQKEAIFEFVGTRGEKPCPIPGCLQKISLHNLVQDQIKLRQIERQRQRQQQEDEEDEDDTTTVTLGRRSQGRRSPSRTVKRERRSMKRERQDEDDDEDEDMED